MWFIKRVFGYLLFALSALIILVSIAGYSMGDHTIAIIIGIVGTSILIIGVRLIISSQYNIYYSESWRDDPASDKQNSFAKDLGIDFPRNIKKGELSDLITKKTGR
jgi:hypothetical protein